MILKRGQVDPVAEISWGGDIQPERWDAVVRHTSPGMRILDLGTGRGAYIKALLHTGYVATGVDVRQYAEWSAIGDERFAVASGDALPFTDKSFDVTISFEVLEHCPDPIAVLREIIRCTAQRVVLSVPNCDLDNALRRHDLAMAHWTDPTHINFFTKDSIRELLTSMHFQVIEMADCYRINPSDYFLDSLRLRPQHLKTMLKMLVNRLRLSECYWSSILVVAKVPSQNSVIRHE